jgi:hypothetical protein
VPPNTKRCSAVLEKSLKNTADGCGMMERSKECKLELIGIF